MSHGDIIPPVLVHLVGIDPGVKVESAPAEKRPTELRASHRTAVLTASNPTYNIAAFDPARECIRLNVLDNPVVLSSSTGMASDPGNTGGGLATPNGRLLSVSNGSEYDIPGPDEAWLSAATYPTRVGITIVRRIN